MGGLSCHPIIGPSRAPFQLLRGRSLSASHLDLPPWRSLVGVPQDSIRSRSVFPKPEPVGWEGRLLVRFGVLQSGG